MDSETHPLPLLRGSHNPDTRCLLVSSPSHGSQPRKNEPRPQPQPHCMGSSERLDSGGQGTPATWDCFREIPSCPENLPFQSCRGSTSDTAPSQSAMPPTGSHTEYLRTSPPCRTHGDLSDPWHPQRKTSVDAHQRGASASCLIGSRKALRPLALCRW